MIIFLYGADSFRINQKLKEIKKRFSESVDSKSLSLETIDGQKSNIKDLSAKIKAGSLFAKKRMVIIKNTFENKQEELFNQLAELIKGQDQEKQNVLVFVDQEINSKQLKKPAKEFFAWLKGQKYAQEFIPLNNSQVLIFAKKLFQEKSQKISSAALSLLTAKTGNDLWRLNNEINKLQALATGREIKVDDIENMVVGDFEEKIFSLTDAFAERKNSLTFKILNEQLAAGLSPEYILSMLLRQIKILMEIKSAQKKSLSSNLGSELGLHPFVLKKSLSQAANFNLSDLKIIFNKLIKLEYDSKTGQANLKNELLFLVAKPI